MTSRDVITVLTCGQGVVEIEDGMEKVGPPSAGPLRLGPAGPQRVAGAVQPVLQHQDQQATRRGGPAGQGGEPGQSLQGELLQVLTLGPGGGELLHWALGEEGGGELSHWALGKEGGEAYHSPLQQHHIPQRAEHLVRSRCLVDPPQQPAKQLIGPQLCYRPGVAMVTLLQ